MAMLCRWVQCQYAKREYCACQDCKGVEHGRLARFPSAQKQREIHTAKLLREVAQWDKHSLS